MQQPLVERAGDFRLFAALLEYQLQHEFACPGGRLDRPALPGVQADFLVFSGRIEADFVKVIGAALIPDGVALDVIPAHAGGEKRNHLVFVRKLVGPGVEYNLPRTVVDRQESLHQGIKFHDRDGGGPRVVILPAPRGGKPRARNARRDIVPTESRQAGLDLAAHGGDAFELLQVVEVGQLLAGTVDGKFRNDIGAGNRQGGICGGLDSGVSFGQVIVIGTDQDLSPPVFFGDGLGDREKISGVEGDHRRQAGGRMQCSGRRVALGDQHQRRRGADLEKMALLGQAGRPEILVSTARFVRTDDLQAMNPSMRVIQRDDQRPARRVFHPVPEDALAFEVGRFSGWIA